MEELKPINPTADEEDELDSAEPQEDFAALLDASPQRRELSIEKDRKVEGAIISIGDEWVFVDIGAKSEGAIAREELIDENGALPYSVGDRITAYVVKIADGEIHLSVKMTAAASEEAARDAYRSGVPVEGLVTAERKGGFTVRVLGKDAFCPYSQIDLQGRGTADQYLDKRFLFRIAEYREGGRNIVVSRRDILEEERRREVERLKETLRTGDLIEGTVRNVTDFGAFVDLGGIEGLVPMSELAWFRVAKASDIVNTGDRVTVKVLDLNWETKRISLSLKQTIENPWDRAADVYVEGRTLSGTVTKLMNFGAFVELEPGVEGMIHISRMGTGRRINHPREVLAPGDAVDVTVVSVDRASRRIGLELNVVADEESAVQLNVGDMVTGIVDSVQEYGVFITLPGGKTGLLHVSEIPDAKRGDLKRRFPQGSPIEVEILEINPETNKIALSARSLDRRREEAQYKDFVSDKRGGSFGTLGDILADRLKK